MTQISLQEIKTNSGVGFGTSGIRNKATALTDKIVYAYAKAFIEHARKLNDLAEGKIAIAGDLRDSTPRILKAVVMAIVDDGLTIINCGLIPTPAVMYFGSQKNIPSIMVTGSHIPADRNGVKYNLAKREILKADEAEITQMVVEVDEELFNEDGSLKEAGIDIPEIDLEATEMFISRYTSFFNKEDFEGRSLGLYGHSSVGKDIIERVLTELGAKVTKIDYSEAFIPVDTEAVEESLVLSGKEWIKDYGVESIITTDGDSDRPLLTDENGEWFRADTTGIFTARYLGSKFAVMPVSCNTAAELSGQFEAVFRTKIGSPFVVEEMMNLQSEDKENIIGYEANGGFLIMDDINLNGKTLLSLPTRDATVVLLSILALAKRENKKLSELRLELPQRFSESDSIKGFPTDKSLKIVDELATTMKAEISDEFGEVEKVNETDGARFYFKNGDIVHFRPSRNSTEFREYVESDSETKAKDLSKRALELIGKWSNI